MNLLATVVPVLGYTLIFLSIVPLAYGQAPDSRRFEVGAGYALNRTNFLRGFDKTLSGIAARAGYTLSDHVAVEAEVDLFPQNLEVFSKGMVVGLFGPRVGRRFETLGIFGKARPGFVHFQQQVRPFPCPAVSPTVFECALGGITQFALDAGGVVEFYPQPRITLRFDAGDMMIRFSEPTLRGTFWSHNFQFGTSIGFRF